MSWICRYCGKDTKWIDSDYLVGADHLQCVLENSKVKTKLKITINLFFLDIFFVFMDNNIFLVQYQRWRAMDPVGWIT
jgi:hypothetical protein